MKKRCLQLTAIVVCALSFVHLPIGAKAQENNPNSSSLNSSQNKSAQLSAEELLKRGDAKEGQEAIEDYTAALGVLGIEDSTKELALYNRGNVKGEIGNHQGAIDDYNATLKVPGITDRIKELALYNRGNAKGKLGRPQDAIDDYTAALGVPGIEDSTKELALYNRGNVKGEIGNHQGAIDDYTAALGVPGIEDSTKASALCNRGNAKGKLGRPQEAINDFEAALGVPGIEDSTKANVLYNLEIAKTALQVNPAPFGLEIGKATLKDLKVAGHSIVYSDKSLWDGMIYKVETRSLGLEGLQEASFIFNDQEILQAVLLVMNKDHFSFMLNSLSEKYKLVHKEVPFVGNRQARFTKGNCVIDMDSPHLSFSFEITYMTKEFEAIYKKKHQQKVDQKKKEQKALL